MANTFIQLKYSDATSTPTTLNTSEPAYSNSSNKLFIGQSDGSVVAIGGKFYTALIDAATNANTASTIVKRDADNNFTAATITANLSGNATTATAWKTTRALSFTGDATGSGNVDGSAAVATALTLASVGTAGVFGNATHIPVITTDAKGRVTSVTNTAISASSALSIAGDTGTDTVTVGTNTLTFEGGDGITSVVTDNKASFAVDNTVLRTSGNQISSGDLTVANLGVTGNLTVAGAFVTQDVANISTEDPLIQLAANNTANLVDIGLFGQANTGSSIIYTALFRDATDGKYRLLTDGTELPTSTVNISAFSTATLVTDIETSGSVTVKGTNLLDKSNTTLTLTQAAFDKANTANTTADAAFAKANSANVLAQAGSTLANTANTTADAAFAKANTANVTAEAAFSKANTDATSISTTAGVYGNASINQVFTLAANGRISDITNTTIAIAASAITSGTLGLTRGGTGFASYTANGVIIGGVTSTSALSSVASSTEGHVLQINSSGIPVFGFISGGLF